MSTAFQLVPITPDLVSVYKQVRLAALQDSPAAFCASYARESQLTDEDWLQRTTRLDGINRIGFLALVDMKSPVGPSPTGLVCCFRNADRPTQANVISMWVAPSHRGCGLSSALLEAVLHWARFRGFAELQLLAVSNNDRAIAFYERYGFRKTGHTQPHGNDPALSEVEMALPLLDHSGSMVLHVG